MVTAASEDDIIKTEKMSAGKRIRLLRMEKPSPKKNRLLALRLG
jgi:hypothetical protein